jgi:hypothetical protein
MTERVASQPVDSIVALSLKCAEITIDADVLTLNQRVQGSSPCAPTIENTDKLRYYAASEASAEKLWVSAGSAIRRKDLPGLCPFATSANTVLPASGMKRGVKIEAPRITNDRDA